MLPIGDAQCAQKRPKTPSFHFISDWGCNTCDRGCLSILLFTGIKPDWYLY